MTDEPKGTGTPHAPVKPIDYTAAFFLVVTQAPTRNVIEVIQGEDAEVEARARAATIAKTTGRMAAVVGPQKAVYAPPPPVVAQEVPLPFAAG